MGRSDLSLEDIIQRARCHRARAEAVLTALVHHIVYGLTSSSMLSLAFSDVSDGIAHLARPSRYDAETQQVDTNSGVDTFTVHYDSSQPHIRLNAAAFSVLCHLLYVIPFLHSDVDPAPTVPAPNKPPPRPAPKPYTSSTKVSSALKPNGGLFGFSKPYVTAIDKAKGPASNEPPPRPLPKPYTTTETNNSLGPKTPPRRLTPQLYCTGSHRRAIAIIRDTLRPVAPELLCMH